MTFGGPLLKRKKFKTQIIEIPAKTLQELIAVYLNSISYIKDTDDVVSVKLPEYFQYSMPVEIKTQKLSTR